jgi:large subunit ribosomal protein L2
MLGQLSLKNNKNFQNGKAGYWRMFGSKSLVRGVAMNAVDHPHGGRTKSVKCPKTPWGKPTKLK